MVIIIWKLHVRIQWKGEPKKVCELITNLKKPLLGMSWEEHYTKKGYLVFDTLNMNACTKCQ